MSWESDGKEKKKKQTRLFEIWGLSNWKMKFPLADKKTVVKPDVLNVCGPEQKWPITNVVIVVIKREFSEDTEDSQQKPQQTRRQWVGWAPPVLGRLHGRRWRLSSLLSTSLTFATAPACFRLLSSLTGISVVFWPVYPPWCCCHLVAKSCLTLSIS